jgi:iron complex transport system substrate-binding protein
MREIARRPFLIGAIACIAGCSRSGRTSARPIERVVSISPSTTEAIFAIGQGRRLVGRSRYCDYPPEVKGLPAVGGFVDPSLEAVLAQRPDLVIGVQGPGLKDFAARLEGRDILTYFPPTQSFAEIEAMLVGLARLLSDEPSGRRTADRIEADRNKITTALANRRLPRAMLVFGLRPIVVAGPGSFADEMLRFAGAENVVHSERTRFPSLGIERVLALDPDVIVDATGGAKHEGTTISRDLPGWSEVRAIREQRVVAVSDDRVLRPGPRVAEGLAILARAIHPDLDLP